MDTAINGSSEGVNILPGLSKLVVESNTSYAALKWQQIRNRIRSSLPAIYLNLVGQELVLGLWVIKAVAIHLRSSLSAIHI